MLKLNKKKPSGSPKSQRAYLKEGTKYSNIIDVFMTGNSLNRFEAEELGDHCLHSTVSTLVNTLGLEIHRKWEAVSNRFGGTTRVKRYWFSESDIAKIRKILGKEL